MMKMFTLALWMLGVPSAAAAAGGITYDCDTAAGHFSELVLPPPTPSFAVTGNLRVNSIAKDKEWAPMARVRIATAPTSPGASPASFAGLQLTALPGKAVQVNMETVQLFSLIASGQEDRSIRGSLKEAGSVQPFRLSYDGRAVTVAVGSETQTYPMTLSNPVVQVVCSTGEFLITDLTLTSQ